MRRRRALGWVTVTAPFVVACQLLLPDLSGPKPDAGASLDGNASSDASNLREDAASGDGGEPFRCPEVRPPFAWCTTFDGPDAAGTFTRLDKTGVTTSVVTDPDVLRSTRVLAALEISSTADNAVASVILEDAPRPIACDVDFQVVNAPTPNDVSSLIYFNGGGPYASAVIAGNRTINLTNDVANGSESLSLGLSRSGWNHVRVAMSAEGVVSATTGGPPTALKATLRTPFDVNIGLTGEIKGWTIRFANVICTSGGADGG